MNGNGNVSVCVPERGVEWKGLVFLLAVICGVCLIAWAVILKPIPQYCSPDVHAEGCITCPTHEDGVRGCSGGIVVCDRGYEWIENQCVLNEAVHGLCDALTATLRRRLADSQCSGLWVESVRGKTVSPWMSESELKEAVRTFQSLEYFDDLFTQCLREAKNKNDINFQWTNTERQWTALTTTHTPPLPCRIELFVWDHPWRTLLTITAILFAVWMIRGRRLRTKMEKLEQQMIEEVYNAIIAQRNKEQQWVAEHYLHDKLTPALSALSTSRKNIIWDRVTARVRSDSRIKSLPRFDNGQQVETWQWVMD